MKGPNFPSFGDEKSPHKKAALNFQKIK